ncbi:hypothetical protein [Streptomyces sp. NPDC096030]|uniref:hypothetical protein n=1 Tax=Streptomyces sp. NPDC096030 TaxID=3155423 RepID=UPI00331F8372
MYGRGGCGEGEQGLEQLGKQQAAEGEQEASAEVFGRADAQQVQVPGGQGDAAAELVQQAGADAPGQRAGVIAACRRAGARFSIITGMNPSVKRAVHGVPGTAWQQITYPTPVPDPETGELISDAEAAEG